MTTLEDFIDSFKDEFPSASLSAPLKAMWYDAKGNWQQAHEVAQDINSPAGSLIHAYLHRKEGDDSNAKYWYSSARENFPLCSIEDEWKLIVEKLLQNT